uniref:Rpn family recombination-promoting nuclease/putative transposase n=1 Tax=Saccharibacillus sp. CPCC 101409 TaxID=3058041 RepID=UPI0034A0730C
MNQTELIRLELLDPYTDKDAPQEKQSILDIRAKTIEGELINVEMQLFNQFDMEKRTLYYWSKQYSGQLLRGQTYDMLKRCITINIVNFSLLDNELYHNVFHLSEDRTGIPLTDDIEIHFLELTKLSAETVVVKDAGLANWLLFLKNAKDADKSQLEVLSMSEPKLDKALDTLEVLSQDEEARQRYYDRQKFLMDEASRIKAARTAESRGLEKGIELGRAQGEKEGKKVVALGMLGMDLDEQIIAKATGLELEEIRNLRGDNR